MKKGISLYLKENSIYFLPLYILLFIMSVCSLFTISFRKESTEFSEIAPSVIPETHEISVKISDGNIKKFNIEDYLKGVVSAEMPPGFHPEALKAQGVAARTYIINRQKNRSPDHPEADVCTDPAHCKAYITEKEAMEKWSEKWNDEYKNKIYNAVDSTAGEIITYENEPITAVFHSTSSGKTENSGEVWQNQVPYLKSVESEGEELSPRYKSSVEITTEDFIAKIKEMNSSATFENNVVKISNYEFTEGGSVKSVCIGGVNFKGTEIRSKFSLRSANFRIIVGDRITFDVTGNGHGVGMSQYGANYAAASGMNYKDILKKYYCDTSIEKIY